MYQPAESNLTDAVEQATQQHKEACEQRLARIQNGADPIYKNGSHVVTLEQNDIDSRFQWRSTSGRHSPVFRSRTNATNWRRLHPDWD